MLQQGGDVVIPVPGGRIDPVRNDPYLQEFQWFREAVVEFAVLNTRSGAHHLDFSARDSVAVVQAVSVAEPSFQEEWKPPPYFCADGYRSLLPGEPCRH